MRPPTARALALLPLWLLCRALGPGLAPLPAARAPGFAAIAGGRRALAAMGALPAAGVAAGSETRTAEGTVTRSMTDREILANLKEVHGWRAVDMGADGDCLFLSIAPQVSSADVASLPQRSAAWAAALGAEVGGTWEALDKRARARLLRRAAVLEEKEFIATLGDLHSRGEALSPDMRFRVAEMFKDMLEEFISSGLLPGSSHQPWDLRSTYTRVQEHVRDTPEEEVVKFVLKNAEQYIARTSREGNWAGSSEVLALASALGRPFEAYGNNWVSKEAIDLRAGEGGRLEVLPYFRAPPAGAADAGGAAAPPVRIFQVNGGGHYQMLSP